MSASPHSDDTDHQEEASSGGGGLGSSSACGAMSAALQKMMEKMGYSKGRGLGKDEQVSRLAH